MDAESHTSRWIHGLRVWGVQLDLEARCAHYHLPEDIVAIRMACCHEFYACLQCHSQLAGHPAMIWPKGSHRALAVFCGACGHQMTIAAYLNSHSACPHCRHQFNPRCSLHWPQYFSVEGTPET